MSKFTRRPYQKLMTSFMLRHPRCNIWASMGSGKCLKRGTEVIMFDGTTKKVEDVIVGDVLMGPDSTPRNVLSLGRGREMMYEVKPRKGESYTVNESHILSLRTTTGVAKGSWPDNTVFDISVRDWLKLPKYVTGPNGYLKGWRVPVDFPRKEQDEALLPPYLMGLWLGDGTSSSGPITSGENEKEIRAYLESYAARNGMQIRKEGLTWSISHGNTGHKKHGFTHALKSAGVLNNKHIPHNYKCGDRRQRLELLAGLLDSDGYCDLSKAGFDWISVSERLADDFCYLCRSLGFAAYKKKTRKRCANTDVWGDYFRVSVSGDFSEVPFVRGRHQNLPKRNINKNVLNVGIESITPVGVDDYYGFTIDGDHRFLLGDFTVTHNTSSTMWVLSRLFRNGQLNDDDRVLILAPLRVASGTWPAEQEKWNFPCLSVVDATGSEKRRIAALESDANVVCTNYEVIEWLIDYYGKDDWPFTVIVADESTKLKSFRSRSGGSKRARALSKVAFGKVKRFINLTGTPSPNGLKDLWGQNWFIDAGERLGSSYTAFTDRWFSSVQKGKSAMAREYHARPGADNEIHQKMKDISLTIDAAEWFGCEAPVIVPVEIDLPKKARQAYIDMEEKLFAELESGEVEAANAAAKTSKCLQIASGAVYVSGPDGEATKDWEKVHDTKLDALESIVEELQGAPLLVAYQFKHELERILKRFPQAQAFSKGAKGNKQMEAWNRGEIEILCVHPASAGHGLNLQDGGHHLAFISQGWNLEHYLQVVERIGPVRQKQAGHERPVFLYHIVAKDTLDEVVAARTDEKKSVQEELLNYMKRRGKK